MNENMYEIDYTRALPPPFKSDEKMFALGRVIAARLQENVRLSRLNIIYARIDELPENVLDVLAVDMHIDWYDDTCRIDVKRQVIKDSVKIHKRKGTKYAVEQAVRNYQTESHIKEWFEYGGEPYFFRVIIDGWINSFENYNGIIRSIFETKNVRSWLEKLIVRFEAKGTVYFGQVAKQLKSYEVDAVPLTQTVRPGTLYFACGGKQSKGYAVNAIPLTQTVKPGLLYFACGGKQLKSYTVNAIPLTQTVKPGVLYIAGVGKQTKRFSIAGKALEQEIGALNVLSGSVSKRLVKNYIGASEVNN